MSLHDEARREIPRIIASISEANQDAAERLRSYHKRMGNAPTTARNALRCLQRVDAFLQAPAQHVSVHDLRAFVESMQDRYTQSTIHQTTTGVRIVLKHLGALTDAKIEALATRRPRYDAGERLLSEAEWHSILQAGNALWGNRTWFWYRLRALLWLLWSTGLRIGEALALDIRHIELDNQGMTVQVPDKEGCKTGARRVFTVDGAGPIQAWLSVHPDPSPEAPLFCGQRQHREPWYYAQANKALKRLGDAAGTNIGTHRLRFHDFRHTAATAKARLGWNESQLRAYFGWRPGSTMPSHYVHLAQGDMRERVLRDAGIDGLGYRAQAVRAQ